MVEGVAFAKSNDFPITRSLMGKKEGEQVTIQTLGGEIEVAIQLAVVFENVEKKASKNTSKFFRGVVVSLKQRLNV